MLGRTLSTFAGGLALEKGQALVSTLRECFDVPLHILDPEGESVAPDQTKEACCVFRRGIEGDCDRRGRFWGQLLPMLRSVGGAGVWECPARLCLVFFPLRVRGRLAGVIVLGPVPTSALPGEARLDFSIVPDAAERAADCPLASSACSSSRDRKEITAEHLQSISRFVRELVHAVGDSVYELADTVAALAERDTELALLYEAMRRLPACAGPAEIAQATIEEAQRNFGQGLIFVMLLDETGERLETVAAKGEGQESVRSLQLAPPEGLLGSVLETEQGVIDNRFRDDVLHRRTGLKLTRIMAAPLLGRGGPVGVLVVADRQRGTDFLTPELKFLSALAGPAGLAIENARLSAEVAESKEREERARRESAFMAVHSIGNVFFGMEGYLIGLRNALGNEKLDRDEVGRLVDGVGRACMKGSGIVRAFKDSARPVELSLEPCDLNRLVAETARSMQATTLSRSIQLAASVSPEPIWTMADGEHLSRALGELVENAASFLDEGGEILLDAALSESENRATIQCRDTGPGVPVDMKEEIFRPFRSTRGQGTGLGLAYVRQVVGLHGGSITEEGVAGEGALFVVVLPIREDTGPRRGD